REVSLFCAAVAAAFSAAGRAGRWEGFPSAAGFPFLESERFPLPRFFPSAVLAFWGRNTWIILDFFFGFGSVRPSSFFSFFIFVSLSNVSLNNFSSASFKELI